MAEAIFSKLLFSAKPATEAPKAAAPAAPKAETPAPAPAASVEVVPTATAPAIATAAAVVPTSVPAKPEKQVVYLQSSPLVPPDLFLGCLVPEIVPGSLMMEDEESSCIKQMAEGSFVANPHNGPMLFKAMAKNLVNLQLENRILRVAVIALLENANREIIEFDVPKWSTIVLAPSTPGAPPSAAMYSAGTPTRIWGYEFWIKVEKTAERVGMYLCCGSGVDEAHEKRLFPISVDYQLGVRRRGIHKDEIVCSSVKCRTEFGLEKAWGFSRFSTMDAIERADAYVRSEDIISFAISLWPVRGLLPCSKIMPTGEPSKAS